MKPAIALCVLLAVLIAGCPAAQQEPSTMDGAQTPLTPETAQPVTTPEPAVPAAAETTTVTRPIATRPVPATPATPAAPVTRPGTVAVAVPAAVPAAPARLPRLVDLGRTSCIPCRMMAPILEQLKTEYAGRVEVEFIDISVDPVAAQRYGIRSIPTQIFFAADGTEVGRHEGFLAKEEMVNMFRQMGVQ